MSALNTETMSPAGRDALNLPNFFLTPPEESQEYVDLLRDEARATRESQLPLMANLKTMIAYRKKVNAVREATPVGATDGLARAMHGLLANNDYAELYPSGAGVLNYKDFVATRPCQQGGEMLVRLWAGCDPEGAIASPEDYRRNPDPHPRIVRFDLFHSSQYTLPDSDNLHGFGTGFGSDTMAQHALSTELLPVNHLAPPTVTGDLQESGLTLRVGYEWPQAASLAPTAERIQAMADFFGQLLETL